MTKLVLQPDGKIVIGGQFTMVGGVARNRVARLNPDGTLDGGFSDPDANGIVNYVEAQADGRILIGGRFTQVVGVARGYVARLNADGTLDAGFDPNVEVADPVNDRISCIAVQPNGAIVIGGTFIRVGGAARNNVARLDASGNLDTGFDPNIAGDGCGDIAVQSDGMIVYGGDVTTVGGVARNNIARVR